MFLSKIWFFVITVIAILAITIALVMPKPAERAALQHENKNVHTACQLTNMSLLDAARVQIRDATEYAQAIRELKLGTTLTEASKVDTISAAAHRTVARELDKLIPKNNKLSFVWILDKRGRVVTRWRQNSERYGDSVRGYYLVRDALEGYVRDDLWMLEEGLYRVSAAPILTRNLDWAGAIVLGRIVNQEFAQELSNNIQTEINFYVSGHSVAASSAVQIHSDIVKGAAEVLDGEECSAVMRIASSGQQYVAVNKRLPGEAGVQGAFYTVYTKQGKPSDFLGTLRAANKTDLGFGNFPWLSVIALLLIFLTIGFLLLFREVDGPLRRLSKEALGLAKGEKERFDETLHSSKFGSIARSINIAIDKIQREGRAAKKDIDQLLGPTTSELGGGLGLDTGISSLPPVGPSGHSVPTPPPPPSEFKFGLPKKNPGLLTPSRGIMPLDDDDKTPPPIPGIIPNNHRPMGLPGIPTPRPVATDNHVRPKPVSLPSSAPQEIDEFELPTQINQSNDTIQGEKPSYFETIFDEFIAMKKQCGEPTAALTFERFSKKLTKNQDALMAKHGCTSVKFQVYEKDGKAALKASPVK